MRVRMTSHITGTRDGQPWPEVGADLEVPDIEGRDLIAAGLAETPEKATPEAPEETPETPEVDTPETPGKPKRRPKKR